MAKLKLSTKNKWVLGVAAGIAEHLNVDPIIIRIIFVLLTPAAATGILLYLLTYIFMKNA